MVPLGLISPSSEVGLAVLSCLIEGSLAGRWGQYLCYPVLYPVTALVHRPCSSQLHKVLISSQAMVLSIRSQESAHWGLCIQSH